MSKLMPPRKRDWTEDNWQVGVFIRTPDGTVVEYVSPKAVPKAAEKLLGTLHQLRRCEKGASHE